MYMYLVFLAAGGGANLKRYAEVVQQQLHVLYLYQSAGCTSGEKETILKRHGCKLLYLVPRTL